MKYMGSKRKIAKDILPIILQNRKENQWYVEPFCGGCNLIDKVNGNRIASDVNKYLIAFLIGIQNGRDIPVEISKDLYDRARVEYNNSIYNEFDEFSIGCIGFLGSVNGRFFDGGYSGITNTKNGTVRDYVKESIANVNNQINDMKGIKFFNCSYDELDIPENSIIYCDPPYNDTKKYSVSKNFNYEKFWDWCRAKSKQHEIYISEFNAPNDFECLWEKEVVSGRNLNEGYKTAIEKLFTINNKNTKSLSLF